MAADEMSNASGDDPREAATVVPYLRRVDELEEVLPSVAFFVCKYAIEKLNALRARDIPNNPARTAGFTGYLLRQIERAEALKTRLEPEAQGDGKTYMREFCLGVYKKAEASKNKQNEDISKELIFQYYVVGIFIDTMSQFGPIDADLQQIRSYTRLFTVELKRLFDAGETRIPEGLSETCLNNGNLENSIAISVSSAASGQGSSPPPPVIPHNGNGYPQDDSGSSFSAREHRNTSRSHCTAANDAVLPSTGSGTVSPGIAIDSAEGRANLKEAIAETKYALSALTFNDIEGGIKFLKNALSKLGVSSSSVS